MKKQVHIYYSGRVQGIGFRYTVRDMAGDQKVLGWVKNLPDYRVEVVAEAEEEALNGFLVKIDQHFSEYIQNSDIQWLPANGGFRDFSIKF